MQKLAEQIIIDILKQGMDLPNDTIWIRDTNKKIPNDDRLYCVVGMVDSVVYAANRPYLIEKQEGMNLNTYEVRECQVGENIQIDIFSRSNAAITRKWEVITSLNSIYSKQQQELYQFKLANLPRSFVNSSYPEGAAQLPRFSLIVTALTWQRVEKLLSPDGEMYYDTFSTRVDDEKTIGTDTPLIEFTIPE